MRQQRMITFEGFIESLDEIERQKFWRQCNVSLWLKGVKQNTLKKNPHVVLTYLLIIYLLITVIPLYKKIMVPLYSSSGKVFVTFIHSFSQ